MGRDWKLDKKGYNKKYVYSCPAYLSPDKYEEEYKRKVI